MQIIQFSSVFWVVSMSSSSAISQISFPTDRYNSGPGPSGFLGAAPKRVQTRFKKRGLLYDDLTVGGRGNHCLSPIIFEFWVLTEKNNMICINALSQPDFYVRSLSENNVTRAKNIFCLQIFSRKNLKTRVIKIDR